MALQFEEAPADHEELLIGAAEIAALIAMAIQTMDLRENVDFILVDGILRGVGSLVKLRQRKELQFEVTSSQGDTKLILIVDR